MHEKPFVIYKSSAGSGKTFTLAKEYVKLALRSPHYYKHILAVTFTNRAAEEMRERIIAFLVSLSNGKDSISDIIREETGLKAPELKIKAQASLSAILHGYSFFSITTIDTFFHKIIRTFTREMGLQGNFSIEMDLNKVLEEVVDTMLEEVHQNDTLKDWLVDFSRERLLEGKNWEFRTEIKKLAYELFKEEYKVISRNSNQDPTDQNKIKDFVTSLNNIIHSFQKTLQAQAKKALSSIDSKGLSIPELVYGKAGPASFFLKTSNGDFSPPGKRTLEAVGNPEKWSSKSSSNKERIVGIATESLNPIASEMISFYEAQKTDYNSAIELKKYIYTYGILTNIRDKINLYREENDVMLISDFSSFLNDIINGSDAPYIYEKVGTRIKHYLIDEFQDTSQIQWNNFFPLIEDSLASGQQNLIVGDVKQSIYRWRGGDFNLLLNEVNQSMGDHNVNEFNLNTNYRSLPTIINFNNELFSNASVWLKNNIDLEKSHPMLESITKAFEDVSQKTIHAGKAGQVEIIFQDTENTALYNHAASNAVIEKIEQLQDQGYALRDIAILVRSHDEAKTIVKALLEKKRNKTDIVKYSYDVVSSESMFLTSSPVVRFLISVLTFLDDQGNKVALKEIVHQYHRDILQDDMDSNSIFMETQEGQVLPESFWKYKEVLIRLPFYELIETLVRIFELKRLEQEYAFLVGFQDCVLNFAKDGGTSIGDFMLWWRETGIKKTINMPDSLDAIKVLTIHKSKGLQFKSVIIPFCNWNFDHNATLDTILWANTEKIKGFNIFDHLPVKYSKRLEDTHLSERYQSEKILAHIDNLNVLYVALTRAEEQLFLVCKKNESKSLRSVADLIFKFVNTPTLEWTKDGNSYSIGTGKKVTRAENKNDNSILLSDLVSYPWRNRVATKTTHSNYVGIVDHDGSKRHFGILVHELLSKVKVFDDLSNALKEIETMNISDFAKQSAATSIRKIMRIDALKTWFSEEYIVKAEAPILTKGSASKRPDRVMIKGKDAVILDYKTGSPNSQDNEQILNYQKLLQQMGYTHVEAYLLYINEAKLHRVA